jgi:hypothetical protein
MITLDDSLWPLVTVRFVGTPPLWAFEAYLETSLGILRRGRHLLLVDVDRSRGDGTAPPEHRQLLVNWLARHEERIRQTVLGVAYATDSAMIRLALSLIFHLKPPAAPYVIAPNLELGMTWATCRLNEAGLHADAERIRGHFRQFRQRRHG